ncbi:hypothetical protein H2203_001110 [Taxawa tesnikishii (nom. ined.)]|nr:hypothetical protein H2203_001110 [Dothideales sp. JES 119]
MGAGAGEAPAPVAATNAPSVLLGKNRQWNTNNLGLRLCADGAAAATAGVLVAPVITMIDRAIIENASGRQALMPSLRASVASLLLRPHHFLISRPFRLIFALYTGTYLTANILDTTISTTTNKPSAYTESGVSKFVATSGANLSLCLYKDSQFTRIFGAVSSRPVPPVSYALFAARDCMTIFASFNIPLARAAHPHRAGNGKFAAPASVQLLSTPLHLLGLDLYNRREGVSFAERMRKVRLDWLKSSLARMCRIVPAFGVGGVVNTRVRSTLINRAK